MFQFLFSFIIPTLNEEKFLPKLLTDLTNQKEKDFEVIIVDGYSQDQTKKIALDFKEKLNLRFFELKEKNVSAQRNYGAKKAKGRYLIFIDADNRVFSSFLKKLKKFIFKKKGLIFIPQIIPDEDNVQTKLIFQFVNLLIELSQNFNKPLSAGGNLIFEKNFFDLIGGFDEKIFISEDHQIIQKAKNYGVTAKCLKNIKVKFSLRRFRKEGELTVFYKYLISFGYMLIKGDIKKKLFDYEMGGQLYKKKINESLFYERLNQLKKFFSRQIKNLSNFKFSQ